MSNRWWSIFGAGQNVHIEPNRQYSWAILVVFAAMTVCLPAWAQSNNSAAITPILTQQEIPKQLQVGSIQNLTLEVQHPVGSMVVVESPPNTRRAELIGQEATTAPSGSELKTTLTLKYGFFRTGEVRFPAIQVNVDVSGTVTPVTTTPITVSITPVLSAGEGLSGPQSTVAMWVDDYTLVWIGGFFLFVLALGVVTFFARRRANEILEATPPRPAYDIAIEKLLELESSGLLERGDFMIFYVRLSETFREYLGERYNFPGTEFTTTEISVRLSDVKWPLGMELGEVKSILGSSDMVKFGGVIPQTEQGRALLRRAMTVVELTKTRFRQPISSTLAQPNDEAQLEAISASATEPADAEDIILDADTPGKVDALEVAEPAETEKPVIAPTEVPTAPNASDKPSNRWQPPEDSP